MTGAYLRVKRNDKFENVEIEHLTDEERADIFRDKPDELMKWLNFVCSDLSNIEQQLMQSDEGE